MRRHGCLERGPIWEWVDLGDNAFSKYVTTLVQATKIKSVIWRERVIRHLGLIRAADGIPRLLELLDDPVRRVRTSALAALNRLESQRAVATHGSTRYVEESEGCYRFSSYHSHP